MIEAWLSTVDAMSNSYDLYVPFVPVEVSEKLRFRASAASYFYPHVGEWRKTGEGKQADKKGRPIAHLTSSSHVQGSAKRFFPYYENFLPSVFWVLLS